jgi:hypothetical protein
MIESVILRNLAVVAIAGILTGSAGASAPLVGIQATLTSQIPAHAAPGTHFSLSWKFGNGSGSFDPGLGGAMTIFVRLSSPDGNTSTTTVAPPRTPPTSGSLSTFLHPDANYRIVATVPRGGVGKIEIGFRLNGATGIFPITNDPLKH